MKRKRDLVVTLCEEYLEPDKLVGDYLRYKELSGCSKFTIENQRSTLRRYMTLYMSSINNLKEQRESIMQYLKNKKSAYFNKELDTLRQFWRYYYKHIDKEEDPCAGISFKPHPSRIVDIDFEIVKKLLKTPNQKTFTGLRDYTFMLLMLDTGIRPQEALRLKIVDIGLNEKTIYVREEYSKTRQARHLPASNQSILYLRRLIAVRHINWSKNAPVFCTFSGENLSSAHVQDRFRWYSKQIGCSVTPYQLRHIFALGFIKNGGDPFTLQRIMGHTRLEQTRTYINLVRIDLTNGHMKATPLNQFLKEEHRIISIKK